MTTEPADTARLDWLERNGRSLLFSGDSWFVSGDRKLAIREAAPIIRQFTARDAIDAAIVLGDALL